MKRKLEFIVLATGILSLVYVNLFALRANRLVSSGQEVLLELAPVDPLSLVQGQYMELEFAIEDSYSLDDAEVQPISRDRELPPNSRFAYFEGSWQDLPDFSTLEAKDEGECHGFDLSVARRRDQFGLQFDATIVIPRDGTYRFHLGSDDGSRLEIDGETVVLVDGIHPLLFESADRELTAGDHAVRVEYFDQDGEEELQVELQGNWSGGRGWDLRRQPLEGLLKMPGRDPVPAETPFTRDLDHDEPGDADRDTAWEADRVVLWLDENDVGRVQRPYQGGPLSEGEILFRAIVDVSERTYHVRLQQRSFLFEENQERRYQKARLGIFRVKENGDYVLVDLADKDFRPLTP